MKKVGILARCETGGLGIQSKEFYDHIPCKALIVDVSRVNQTMRQNHEWYPGAPVVYYTKNNRFPVDVVKNFLKDLEVLVCFETSYDPTIYALCRLMGIKTILQLNYEFLDFPSSAAAPDLFAAPSLWHYDEIPDSKLFLPVPVAAEKFSPAYKANTFVHIAGKPAIHDRNGTNTFLSALKYVKNDINVIVKCQQPLKTPTDIPSHINIKYDFANHPNYWENYTGGVLVMPRKYGGLCLPVNEALAAAMPVIMPDISPNFTWMPKEWLVPAKKSGSFQCKKKVDIYETDQIALAAKMDSFCNYDYYCDMTTTASKLAQGISWETLLPKYYEVLFG